MLEKITELIPPEMRKQLLKELVDQVLDEGIVIEARSESLISSVETIIIIRSLDSWLRAKKGGSRE